MDTDSLFYCTCVVQYYRVAEEGPGNRQERLAERHGA